MYELVNTSVPNGLIAGSHGFATVAMTKGMPDAIRSRVENLCAYPHRSSAHDQSYYTENPINWFHLLLPGGDHAVGRTAPAEFDYTGRTNRISRVLHFSSREMPINGGAYVLTAEANRFCQNWSGDPKYLPEDKTLAGRLQMAVRASGFPKNWVNMFGPDGESYAKKFAALLTQNLRTNKCIYFKAGESDVNGERLLGLFSDLINLLPEQLAAQVTFSTFSACVPNGAVCHLRGIFDKDRAFETASALQPWIDCEGCSVRHPELLPDDIPVAIVGNDQSFGSTKTDLKAARPDIRVRHSESNYQQRQSQMVDYWNRRTEEVKKSRISPGQVTLMSFCAIAIFVLLGYLFLGNDIRKRFSSSTEKIVSKQILQDDKLATWRTNRIDEITRLQQDVKSCSITEVKNLKEKIRNDLNGLVNSLKDYYGCPAYQSVKQEIEKLYNDLLRQLDVKKVLTDSGKPKEASIEADDERRRAEEEHRKKKIADQMAKEQVAALTKLQIANEKKEQTLQSRVDMALKDLRITKVVADDVDWISKYVGSGKQKLTRKGCIAIWFCNDGVCKKITTELVSNTVMRVKNQRTTPVTEYELPKVDIGNSNWELINAVVDEKNQYVLWRWHRWPEKQILAEGKIHKSTLIDACFGHEDAYTVWQQYVNNKVQFLLEPAVPTVGYRYVATAFKTGDVIKEWEETCCAKFDKQISDLQSGLENADADKKKCDKEIADVASEIEKARVKLAKLESMSSKEKKEKGFGGKTNEQSIKDEIEKIMEPLLKKIKGRFNRAAIKQGIDDVERRLCVCRHPGNHNKANIQQIIEKRKGEKAAKLDELRAAIYKIQVISELLPGCKMGWNKIKKQESREE